MSRPVPSNPWARWALDTAERAVRTMAQGFVSVVTVDQVTSMDASWGETMLAGLLAGAFSIVLSLAAKPAGANDSASFLPERTDPPQGDNNP